MCAAGRKPAAQVRPRAAALLLGALAASVAAGGAWADPAPAPDAPGARAWAASGFPGQTDRSERRPAKTKDPQSAEAAQRRARDLGAMGLSLVLPGLAHLRAGETGRGVAFLTAEAGFWTAFSVFTVQGKVRKDSYVEIARLHGGIRASGGRSDDYYRLIGTWPSSDLYDEYVTRRDARTLYGDDLTAREEYYQAHRVPADQAWSWETYAAWQAYQDKRSESARSYRWRRNMLGLALANRLVAAVDAALLSRRGGAERSTRLELTPAGGGDPLAVRLSLRRALP